MYPVKLRKVLGNENGTSHEYSPVQVVQVKGGWKEFIKEHESRNNKYIDYAELEELIRGTLEHIVLEAMETTDIKVAELEIDTGYCLIYVTVTKDIATLVESETIFTSENMRPPKDTTLEFNTGWVNRLDLITQVGVRLRKK